MSFRFGIDDYIYYSKVFFQKRGTWKELVSTEIFNTKKYDEGEKK